MKRLLLSTLTLALLLMPFSVYSQSGQSSKEAPPVSQALISEGDFALKLAPALGLGTPDSEAQAEDMLTSIGVAPKNGWIADYPVTPDIIGELQDGVSFAADSKRLPMGKDDALAAFHNLTVDFGLAVVPGSPGQYAENQPQPDSTMLNNYYADEGPPVVTYYPPPWDYGYLYAWVPYPFWWGGFFFSGFFCLHDFHRFHHNHLISNHFVDPVSRTVARVDPAGRTTGNSSGATRTSRNRGFNSTEARRGATSIFERSRGQDFSRGDNRASAFSGRGEAGSVSRSMTGRTTTPGNIERGARGPSAAESRGSNGPARGNERSSASPSAGSRNLGFSENPGRTFSGSNRSFSAPSSGGSGCVNCHGGSGSFGRGGSSSRGFAGSGSSRGGSFSGGGSSRGGSFSGGGSNRSGSFSGGGSSGVRGGGGGGGHGGGGRGR